MWWGSAQETFSAAAERPKGRYVRAEIDGSAQEYEVWLPDGSRAEDSEWRVEAI